VIRVLLFPVEAPGQQGPWERSGENDCEGGMIRTRQLEGGVGGGEVRNQGRVGKAQVKNCGAMIGGESEPSADRRCIEERKQLS